LRLLAWDSSYYLLAILVEPTVHDTHVPTTMVFAAFSGALSFSAADQHSLSDEIGPPAMNFAHNDCNLPNRVGDAGCADTDPMRRNLSVSRWLRSTGHAPSAS
jgi:hypothetical protein